MTVGDRDGNRKADYDQALAQKLDNDVGKIIHLTPEGAPRRTILSSNTHGVRAGNLGLWHPQPGGLRAGVRRHLVGNRTWPARRRRAEPIQKGKNYGWPIITHGIDYPGGPIGEGIVAKEGMEQPVYYWDPVIAPSGLAFITASCFRNGERQSSGGRLARP